MTRGIGKNENTTTLSLVRQTAAIIDYGTHDTYLPIPSA